MPKGPEDLQARQRLAAADARAARAPKNRAGAAEEMISRMSSTVAQEFGMSTMELRQSKRRTANLARIELKRRLTSIHDHQERIGAAATAVSEAEAEWEQAKRSLNSHRERKRRMSPTAIAAAYKANEQEAAFQETAFGRARLKLAAWGAELGVDKIADLVGPGSIDLDTISEEETLAAMERFEKETVEWETTVQAAHTKLKRIQALQRRIIDEPDYVPNEEIFDLSSES
jgi:hypothetical protein